MNTRLVNNLGRGSGFKGSSEILKNYKELKETVIGIVADTHGLLRERAKEQLARVDLIVHAGDFDTPEILAELKNLAPVLAARGNMDRGGWTENLDVYDLKEIGGKLLCVVHDVHNLSLDPTAAGISAVVCGHTHLPEIGQSGGVLFINPGSAGPRRFGKPLSLAKLVIRNGKMIPEVVILDD